MAIRYNALSGLWKFIIFIIIIGLLPYAGMCRPFRAEEHGIVALKGRYMLAMGIAHLAHRNR
jgi:hypothetical protein